MTTYSADSLTTDSAAAATAMALGCKAKLGALGVCADGTLAKSAVEIAREKGMRVGLCDKFHRVRRESGGFCDSHCRSAPVL